MTNTNLETSTLILCEPCVESPSTVQLSLLSTLHKVSFFLRMEINKMYHDYSLEF